MLCPDYICALYSPRDHNATKEPRKSALEAIHQKFQISLNNCEITKFCYFSNHFASWSQ